MTTSGQRRKAPVATERTDEAGSRAKAEFQQIIDSFANDEDVIFGGGKGFGSAALKIKGKLFAMISSRGQFVAKLPGIRVKELIASGLGGHFDPGHGRLTKEWLAVDGNFTIWKDLANEARRYVGRA